MSATIRKLSYARERAQGDIEIRDRAANQMRDRAANRDRLPYVPVNKSPFEYVDDQLESLMEFADSYAADIQDEKLRDAGFIIHYHVAMLRRAMERFLR